MYSSTIFQLMQDYNLSFEETEMLQLKIIGIMGLIALGLYMLQLLIERFCPKLYRKLKRLNIV